MGGGGEQGGRRSGSEPSARGILHRTKEGLKQR